MVVWRPLKKNSASGCNPCLHKEEEVRDFYYGRMIRILPIYYTTYIFALILLPLGYGPYTEMENEVDKNTWGSLAALFGVQSWILAYGFGPCVPAWTVSTLFFFYLLFPR